MSDETTIRSADIASVPVDPFKVKEAVQTEIARRFEQVRILLDEIDDWAQSTKHLPEAEVQTLRDNKGSIVDVHNAFQDRANTTQGEVPSRVGIG